MRACTSGGSPARRDKREDPAPGNAYAPRVMAARKTMMGRRCLQCVQIEYIRDLRIVIANHEILLVRGEGHLRRRIPGTQKRDALAG